MEPSNQFDLKKALDGFANFVNELNRKLHDAAVLIENFKKVHAPQIVAVLKSISEIPADFLAIQQELAKRGWFVSAEMPLGDFRSLIILIEAGDFEELDRVMSMWTLGLIDQTEEALCDAFPQRGDLLREGFDNHRNKRYASAITLLLTQADGICLDLLGQIFFAINRDTSAPYAKDVIDSLGVDMFTEISLHPILVKSGINATDKQIDAGEFPDSPHRHPILHGRQTDYATEINSLKIVSFVGFMGTVVAKAVEQAKEDGES